MTDPQPPSPPHRIRVRYAETDRMGVAHHGNYAAWFEEARTEWLRQQGCSYRDLEDQGFLLQVVDLSVSYKRSVTYDDVIEVTTTLDDATRVTVTLGYEVRDVAGRLVATGSTRLACVNRDGRPQRLPPAMASL